jgi:Tfp pilus assembly protein PilN
VGGLGGWYASVRGAEAHLAARVASLDRELDLLKRMLAPAEAARDALADLTRRAQTIQDLRRGQTAVIRTLDALQDAVPRDAWLTSLEARGPDLRATGAAVSARAVADFTSSLREAGFDAVEIALSRQDLATTPPSPLTFVVTGRLAR